MENARMVYLDWAATAPLSKAAYDAMVPYLMPGFAGLANGNGNANSLHHAGRDAFKVLEDARRSVARTIDARPDEIIFTSGATEADNMALLGIVEGILKKRGRTYADLREDSDMKPAVIVSAIEHDAVLEAAVLLKSRGVDVVKVFPNRQGFIAPVTLEKALKEHPNTILVSIMALNNETGAIMDVAELARLAHSAGALFHSDATQALGKIPISVRDWNVDALSLSSHKIGGPKGVGALYLRSRTPFVAQTVGGGQESNKRSGTQNIAGIVGFTAAMEAVCSELATNAEHMRDLRDKLFSGLMNMDGVEVLCDYSSSQGSQLLNADQDSSCKENSYSPHIVVITCPGFESETLILQLDKRGVYVSGGSACSSRSLEPSHVLSAMGVPRDKALGMLRFSLGPDTTEEEIDYCLSSIQEVIRSQWK